jgi:hypothetical protein
VNDREQRRADLLDAYLTDLQAGIHPSAPVELPESEHTLLERLVSLTQTSQPDTQFTSHLEDRLRLAGQERRAAKKIKPLRSGSLSNLVSRITDSVCKMDRRFFSLAAAGIMIVVILVASFLILKKPDIEPTQVAESFTITPVTGPTVTSVAQNPTEQPSSETPVPIALSSLAPLTDLMESEFGSGGQGGESEPTDVEFVLSAALPESPAEMSFYLQDLPQPVTPEIARQMAESLGLEAQIYMPFRMTDPAVEEGSRAAYVAVDEPIYLTFEGYQWFTYVDKSLAPTNGGHWYPPQSLPPVEQALETAKVFLENAGLLDEPYQILASGDGIQFFHLLESRWPLSRPFAQVYIHPDGQVKEVIYQSFDLQNTGEYPILSAERAWEILRAGPFDGRVWYHEIPKTTAWGEWNHANPKFWAREYPLGGRADLFGSLQVLYPADTGVAPSIRMNDLVLEGDLEPLTQAYQQLMERTSDQEAPLHVWGEVYDTGGYHALRVEGWEETPLGYWSGVITRHDGEGFLLTEEGDTLPLPNLASDIPDGADVYVQGGLWEGRLEWYIIQERPADEGYGPQSGPGSGQSAAIIASVEEVELIYFVPLTDALLPQFVSDPSYRTVQPVWRFKGSTDRGTAFEAYVQAVDESYLKDVVEPTNTPVP